jgi:N-acetylglucosamine-6-phosphate deacetylase
MTTLLLKNAGIVMSEGVFENSSLLVRNGEIAEMAGFSGSADREIDLRGATLYPGFIDIHIHGSAGIDTNSAGTEGLKKLAGFLASRGVTAWMPTLVPGSDENYRDAVMAIDGLADIQDTEPVAQAVGIHYEGVFANEKMCGALRPEYFKKFTGGEIGELPRLKKGVHFTTLAPEVENGIALIEQLVRENWIVSIGHTKAPVELLREAFAAGACHLTHFYNAMTGLHHRDLGVVGWALAHEPVTFDIIADGIHVHPDMLRLACRVKTPDRVSLISDAVLPAGLGDGDYEVWGEKVSVRGGRTQNERGSIAGSVITMLDAVKRMLSLGFTPVEVAKMASGNPAKLLGLDAARGSIEFGKRADLVALNDKGEVVMTMIGGNVV